MRNKKGRKGLGLIAGLLARADAPIQSSAGFVDHGVIVDAAMREVRIYRDNDDSGLDHIAIETKKLREIIADAVKAASEQATRSQRVESELVNDLVAADYMKRGENLMPAVVAAIMEQSGMTSMELNLNEVATVFERRAIEFDVDDGVVTYTLNPIAQKDHVFDESVRFAKVTVKDGVVVTKTFPKS